MKHLGLFEGIGGFSYAAKLMGWNTLAWCEINEFCQTVLKYHFPNAEPLTDIKTTDFTKYANKIDIITGGFPCQPYSISGKRLGKDDERHLWPEMLRAIREVKPRWVVAENVRGLVNWSEGMVFKEVQTDLENEGYQVQSFILPACGTGAPHQRDRIWIIANSKSKRLQRSQNNRIFETKRPQRNQQFAGPFSSTWEDFPTQPPICGRDDGLPTRLDGITFSNWRNESIKAYGNAIVPEMALQIFKTILDFENNN